MRRFLCLLALGGLVSGCASLHITPVVAEAPTFVRFGNFDAFSEGDITAAVEAAKHSEYYLFDEQVCFVMAVNRNKLDVAFGQCGGFIIRTERSHNRWKAIQRGFWNP